MHMANENIELEEISMIDLDALWYQVEAMSWLKKKKGMEDNL